MKKTYVGITMIVVLSLVFVLEWYTVMRPMDQWELPEGYSLERVEEHLKQIAAKPHSTLYHKEEKDKVRSYIEEELKKNGLVVREYTYTNVPTHKQVNVDLTNVYGVLEGGQGSDTYLMLACHYDSASSNPQEKGGYSCGMADDGYGVATILETVRFIKQNYPHRKVGLKVLITDGEELRLLGSKQAVEKNPEIFDGVSAVINVEARGTSGPVILGGINGKEKEVLEWYKKSMAASANSFITGVQGNAGRSDFQNFCKLGLAGIDIMAIDEVENYHTTRDSLEQMSKESLRHYGMIVANMTSSFLTGSGETLAGKGQKQVFFTLLPKIHIQYGNQAGILYGVSSVLLAVGVVLSYVWNNRNRAGQLFKGIGRKVLGAVLILAGGTILAYLLCLITKTTFVLAHMGNFFGDYIVMAVFPLMVAGIILWRGTKKGIDQTEEKLQFLLGQTLCCAVVLVILPGASYLFLALPLFAVSCFVRKEAVSNVLWGIALMVSTIFLAQLIIILYMAFSIAMLGICSFLAAIITYGVRVLFHMPSRHYV